MTTTTRSRRPEPVSLIGGLVTAAGIVLAITVDMSLLILAAVGSFGPGLLRELGVLNDQDEFRRQAAWRAGYHAYLAGGFVAVCVVALLGTGSVEVGETALSAAIVLVVLWLVWVFASLFEFYGARKAAVRTLLIYGAFWLLFNVLGNWQDPMALLMQSLTAAPFLLMAWTAGRWPRATGAFLVLCGAAAIWQFDLYEAFTERELVRAMVLVTFALPLLASGVALLRREPAD